MELDILMMDQYVTKNKIAPKWFWSLKIWCTLFSISGLLTTFYLYLRFDDKIKEKKDIFKRFLEANQSRLNIKIKNSS